MESPSIVLERKTGLYESIILEALSKMNRGSLTLTMPSGQTFLVGDRNGIDANLEIHNVDFFRKVVLYGDIGFGESYMDGDWSTDNITWVISWMLLNLENNPTISGSKSKAFILNILKFFNKLYHFNRANSIAGARKNIAEHYDLNNEFFSLFLDPGMTYSSAYFTRPNMSLEEAQTEKYERICKQLQLRESDHVLEIGSGWGGMCTHIAKKYGCQVTSITISEEQYKYAKERIKNEGLAHKIDIRLMDYRYVEGQYDKIISIEMLEAVGHKFLDAYFKKCHELLRKEGMLALQVITSPDSRYESLRKGVDWIQKHIFPGTLLPSVAAINGSINRTGDMTMIDLKDLGLHYTKTLAMWRENFNDALGDVKKMGFSDTFIRKWNYYLSYCEAAFAMRNINVMQIIYTRPNNANYR